MASTMSGLATARAWGKRCLSSPRAFRACLLKRVDERIKLPITEQWREDSHFVVRVVRGELTVMTSAAGIRDSSAV